ncbi:glycoside hydrolase family 13 protein [bacterium]|nr:glycoside hydrolase family 13 protein [bacterium]
MNQLPAQSDRLADGYFANQYDQARSETLRNREADWRNGALVYQVIVDRFAPPADLGAKRHLYPAPKKLRTWDEVPRQGTYNEEVKVWSHEIDFWGGDLQTLRAKLDYVQDLGIDVLYLNPIQMAYTNHKYDAQDYFKVSPEYGTREDVTALADDLHARGMKLMLDGVLNHMGRSSPWFEEAMKDPKSPWREWYYIGPEYKMGYRGWYDVANLPELNLESATVRARLWGDPDSVIQGYLREGVDGWRLDVAFDIGFRHLTELTKAAHTAKPGSLVIGEIWNYPEEWSPALDAVMNMTARELILQTVRGNMSGGQAGRALDQIVTDTGIEPMLKSWIILDNHDTPRIATEMKEPWQRELAQVLQFTFPGSPCIYYGVEVGMEGGGDPEMRAPMRWDLVGDDNQQYVFMRKLIAARKASRALKIGDYRPVPTEKLFAFLRRTERVEELALVVANPTDGEVSETLLLPDSKVMNYAEMQDALGGAKFRAACGFVQVTVPARKAMILRPVINRGLEYTPYKRVQ